MARNRYKPEEIVAKLRQVDVLDKLILQAIHLPRIDLPAVVPPKNVAVAIAVEVADVLDVPVARLALRPRLRSVN
jgi:hypothetical protein